MQSEWSSHNTSFDSRRKQQSLKSSKRRPVAKVVIIKNGSSNPQTIIPKALIKELKSKAGKAVYQHIVIDNKSQNYSSDQEQELNYENDRMSMMPKLAMPSINSISHRSLNAQVVTLDS